MSEALAGRRSVRAFADRDLDEAQVSQLCWAAQGSSDRKQGLRTTPSAGAIYPLTLFVIDRRGVWKYFPRGHVLRRERDGDVRAALRDAALGQSCVGSAPTCLALAMNMRRMAAEYGEFAERYCLMEVGHAAQNVLLAAEEMGLAGVPIGAFEDEPVGELLCLPARQRAVYLLPVGFPTPS